MSKAVNSGIGLYLTASEMRHVVEAAANRRDRILLSLFYATAGRINEILAIRACDLLEEDSAIRMPNLKRRAGQVSTKIVAVAPETMADYLAYCASSAISGTAYLFPGRRPGSRLTDRRARSIFYRAALSAGVERPQFRGERMGPAWPHLMRHSVATAMVRTGSNLAVIAQQLGHTQIRSTMAYAAVDLADQRAAVGKLPTL